MIGFHRQMGVRVGLVKGLISTVVNGLVASPSGYALHTILACEVIRTDAHLQHQEVRRLSFTNVTHSSRLPIQLQVPIRTHCNTLVKTTCFPPSGVIFRFGIRLSRLIPFLRQLNRDIQTIERSIRWNCEHARDLGGHRVWLL